MRKILNIIGGGMGRADLYSGESLDLIKSSEKVLTTSRIGEKLFGISGNIRVMNISEIVEELDADYRDTTVIVSGDCGFYSLSGMLQNKFADRYEIKNHSGTNSLQYLTSKLGKSYHDVMVVSLHGRSGGAVSAVTYNQKVFLLTDNKNNVTTVLENLKRSGMDNLIISVGENLSDDSEKIITGDIDMLISKKFGDLAVMYIENPNFTDRNVRLRDSEFVRGKVPMTKESVRVLSVNRLEIKPDDVVFDIGAGTGSVSVAMAYKCHNGTVYAVEKNPDAVDLLRQNRIKFGAYNMDIIVGMAPDCLDGLPIPNRAFIGGSSGNLDEILAWLIRKNPNILVCINVITLENLNECLRNMEKYGFSDLDISCMNCANSEKVGRYNMMKAENPIYIISGRRR